MAALGVKEPVDSHPHEPAPLQQQGNCSSKLIANENGVVFFPHTTEHHDAGRPDIKHADNNAGNALAAVVWPPAIEFRFHLEFNDERVKLIAMQMWYHSELQFAASFKVTYQQRRIIGGCAFLFAVGSSEARQDAMLLLTVCRN